MKGPLRCNKSRKPPPLEQHSCIDTFNYIVTRELRQLTTTQEKCNNKLTPSEFKALIALEKNDAIVIKPSDKEGGGVKLC